MARPAASASCRAARPRGPRLPAPIVLRTGCGAFRLATDGSVTPLREGSRPHGTGRVYGANLAIRRNRSGRFFLLRRGRVVWRSTGSYPNDATQVAFGPHSFAFSTARGGVYLTDLRGPERMVARGPSLFPLGISSRGDLLVAGGSRMRVISKAGGLVRSYGYRARSGFAFDDRTDGLIFVTPDGHLAAGPPRAVLPQSRLVDVDGPVSLTPGRLLVFSGERDIVVVRRDGSVLARARWPAADGTTDSGFELAPDGSAIAFRLSTAHPGDRSGTASLYVLRAGAQSARLVYRDRFGPVGCGVAATMSWHGSDLLYGRSGGELAVIDTRSGGVIDASRVVRALTPSPSAGANAAWLA